MECKTRKKTKERSYIDPAETWKGKEKPKNRAGGTNQAHKEKKRRGKRKLKHEGKLERTCQVRNTKEKRAHGIQTRKPKNRKQMRARGTNFDPKKNEAKKSRLCPQKSKSNVKSVK